MEGGTGAGPHIATEDTGVPGISAIREARRAIDELGKKGEISLVYAGGIPDYKRITPFLKGHMEFMGWDDLNRLEDASARP